MGGEETPGPARSLEAFDFTSVLSIADALPMPVALFSPDLQYKFCNRALADFFELRRSAILGQHIKDVIGDKAYEDRLPMLTAALKGERQWFAANFDHPSRGLIALQTEYVPQKDAKGRVTGVVALVLDVTEQRIAERSIRESEARFRRIANSAPVIMWVTRVDRKREFVNDAYLQFAGISREQMNSHEWREWIHPDDFGRLVAESVAGEASLQPFTLEARYRNADGEWRWLRSTSSPRFGPDGELLGFIGAAFDITLTKRGELALKAEVEARTSESTASEARFRAVFDTALEMMALLTPDGEYLEVNRTSLEAMGCELSELVGRKAWELPPVIGNVAATETMKELIRQGGLGQTRQAELNVIIEGKPQTHITSIKPVLGEDGKPIYLVGEARDVSELRGAQEQLRQSQKMEALGQLTGGIAHDFNNLLTVVVGGLDLIAKRVEDAKLQRYAKNALEAAERGARLTAQLLAFSRLQRLEVRPVYVAPLIENMRPLLRNALGPSINKEFELEEFLMPVLADPTQLELVVLNLAINARDAMPGGGSLTFRTRRVEIADDPELAPGEYLELSICDTGSGMPPEVVSRAFDPFFTTKEVGRGTGLGLSMVYGVARQSGGTARIESEVGKGTKIKLYFRRAEVDGSAIKIDEGLQDTAPRRQSAKVLIVDDDPDVRAFVAHSLEDLGFDVREADAGEAGLKLFRQERPDLIVLDFLMPGLSGAEVAEIVRSEAPDQRLLFVSGYSESDAIRAAAPDAALLPKPFRADALAKAVRAALAPANESAAPA